MKRIKLSIAAIIAVAAVGLTIATNAEAFADSMRVACFTEVTTPTGTFQQGDSSMPTSGQTVSNSEGDFDSGDCSGSSRFCCASVSGGQIVTVFQQNP